VVARIVTQPLCGGVLHSTMRNIKKFKLKSIAAFSDGWTARHIASGLCGQCSMQVIA
jgi:hypothetical protein